MRRAFRLTGKRRVFLPALIESGGNFANEPRKNEQAPRAGPFRLRTIAPAAAMTPAVVNDYLCRNPSELMPQPPLLLMIDCSDAQASIGLAELSPAAIDCGGDAAADPSRIVRAMTVTPADTRTAVSLVPTLQHLYRVAGEPLQRTAAVAVTYGPGSFTSLRIGLTIAKTLAYAWDAPLIGVNALDLWLRAVQRHQSAPPRNSLTAAPTPPVTCVCKPAYRGLWYTKQVRFHGGSLSRPGTGHGPSLGVAELTERLALARRRTTSTAAAGAPSPNAATITDWACRQPDPAQTPWSEAQAGQPFWSLLQPTQMVPATDLWLPAGRVAGGTTQTPGGAQTTGAAQAPGAAQASGVTQASSTPGSTNGTWVVDWPLVDESFVARTGQQAPTAVGGHPLTEPRLWPTPDAAQLMAALAELAWHGLATAPLESLDPRFLQPVYFRPSAAEEAHASRGQ